jgi:hypothetical protein
LEFALIPPLLARFNLESTEGHHKNDFSVQTAFSWYSVIIIPYNIGSMLLS